MNNRFKVRERSIPLVWFDLVTFEKGYLDDKATVSYKDKLPDGRTIIRTLVIDNTGKQVYPPNEQSILPTNHSPSEDL